MCAAKVLFNLKDVNHNFSIVLYKPVRNVTAYTIPGIKESSIFIENAFRPEIDSTGLSAPEIMETKKIADSLGLEIHNANDLKRLHDNYVKTKN